MEVLESYLGGVIGVGSEEGGTKLVSGGEKMGGVGSGMGKGIWCLDLNIPSISSSKEEFSCLHWRWLRHSHPFQHLEAEPVFFVSSPKPVQHGAEANTLRP